MMDGGYTNCPSRTKQKQIRHENYSDGSPTSSSKAQFGNHMGVKFTASLTFWVSLSIVALFLEFLYIVNDLAVEDMSAENTVSERGLCYLKKR